jgi:hypothetical protein
VTVPVAASCRRCGTTSDLCLVDAACRPVARGTSISLRSEVVVHEVVVTE